jgi:hypothetical protein
MDVADADDLGRLLKFDLSGIPKDAPVHRAILKITVQRRGYAQPVLLYPVVAKDGKAVRAEQPLALRPPFFTDFDATECARRWVKDPATNLGIVVASAPGWVRTETQLHVSYAGQARQAPAVTNLQGAHQDGQVFLRWREVEDIVGAEEITFGDFETKVLAAWQKRNLFYRVYRHTEPITAANLGQAELVREVEEIRPAYNLDAIPLSEHPSKDSRPSAVAPGGNRGLLAKVGRFRIPMDRQLASGENLSVMTSLKDGRFHYAVTAVVDCYEGVKELTAENSLKEPVVE